MLKKKNRADKKDIDSLFKKGKFFNLPNLTFKYLIENKPFAPKISFVVPKSVAKLAAKRNSLRRMGYNILGKFIKQFPLGLTGVFVFKKHQDDPIIIENEIKKTLSQIN